MPRLFIDCSHVDFANFPTGIPRVVANYVIQGVIWGRKKGYQVIPAVAGNGCYRLLHHFPPDPEGHLNEFLPRPTQRIMMRISSYLKVIFERLRNHIFHLMMTLLLFLPLRASHIEAITNELLKPFEFVTNALIRASQRAGTVGYIPSEDDIVFAPGYWHDVDPEFYINLHNKGCLLSILVHDLLPIFFKQHYNYPWREEFAKAVEYSLMYSDIHFCVSGYTHNSLLEYAQRRNRQPQKTLVVYNGLDTLNHAKSELEKPLSPRLDLFLNEHHDFLIMVGSIEPKKGHLHVINSLSQMWQDGFDKPLLIVGRAGWMHEDIANIISWHPLKDEKLFWFNDLQDSDLQIVYRHARFLLFASVAEGFGLPIIEALHFGCPILAYDTPIAREIAGPFGLFFDKHSTTLSNILWEYEDENRYNALLNSIRGFKWPGWEESAELVFNSLISLKKERSGPSIGNS